MADIAYIETDPDKIVEKATGWAMGLLDKAHRGIGGTKEDALQGAARLANVTPHTIWTLRYRRPREIGASVYFKLQAAHQRHVEAVDGKIADNLAELRKLPPTASRARLVATLQEYLGTEAGEGGGDNV